jgi:hypothetical protein
MARAGQGGAAPTGARANRHNSCRRYWGPGGRVGWHRPEPGLMSAVAAGGTGTQVVGQGGTGRGERGTARAAPARRGWGWAG